MADAYSLRFSITALSQCRVPCLCRQPQPATRQHVCPRSNAEWPFACTRGRLYRDWRNPLGGPSTARHLLLCALVLLWTIVSTVSVGIEVSDEKSCEMADEVAKAAAAAVNGHDGGDTIFGKIIRKELKADIV